MQGHPALLVRGRLGVDERHQHRRPLCGGDLLCNLRVQIRAEPAERQRSLAEVCGEQLEQGRRLVLRGREDHLQTTCRMQDFPGTVASHTQF